MDYFDISGVTYDTIHTYQDLLKMPKYKMHSEIRSGRLFHCLECAMMVSMLQYNHSAPVKVCMFFNGMTASHQLSDNEMPRHQNDFIELSYIVQGTLTINIDQETMTFSENELYLINPNVPYQEIKQISDAVVLNISIQSALFNKLILSNINEDSLQGFLRNCLIQEKSFEQALRFTPTISSVQKQISDLISSILMENKTQKAGYMFIIQGYFIRLFDYLAANYQFSFSEDNQNQYKEYLFQEIKKYMYLHYQNIQVKDLVDEFHYHGNYFNKLIQSYTGMNYSEYLIHIRVKIARDLLEHTTKSIEDIMLQTGYHNKGFFYKVFKEAYGMTPAAYRKSLLHKKTVCSAKL